MAYWSNSHSWRRIQNLCIYCWWLMADHIAV